MEEIPTTGMEDIPIGCPPTGQRWRISPLAVLLLVREVGYSDYRDGGYSHYL